MEVRDLAEWLRDEVAAIHAKLDRMQEHGARVDVTLTAQAKDIAHHIKRTDLLEEQVRASADAMKPVQEHVARVKNVGWFMAGILGVSATVLGLIEAISKLFG
jgi:hypothetical protein